MHDLRCTEDITLPHEDVWVARCIVADERLWIHTSILSVRYRYTQEGVDSAYD